jgi:hypothetical protein
MGDCTASNTVEIVMKSRITQSKYLWVDNLPHQTLKQLVLLRQQKALPVIFSKS